jgi:hypothetical protein
MEKAKKKLLWIRAFIFINQPWTLMFLNISPEVSGLLKMSTPIPEIIFENDYGT